MTTTPPDIAGVTHVSHGNRVSPCDEGKSASVHAFSLELPCGRHHQVRPAEKPSISSTGGSESQRHATRASAAAPCPSPAWAPRRVCARRLFHPTRIDLTSTAVVSSRSTACTCYSRMCGPRRGACCRCPSPGRRRRQAPRNCRANNARSDRSFDRPTG